MKPKKLFEVDGIPVFHVTRSRILDKDKKDDLFYYQIRHDGSKKEVPSTFERVVLVHHYGTIVTHQAITYLETNNFDNSKEITIEPYLARKIKKLTS